MLVRCCRFLLSSITGVLETFSLSTTSLLDNLGSAVNIHIRSYAWLPFLPTCILIPRTDTLLPNA